MSRIREAQSPAR